MRSSRLYGALGAAVILVTMLLPVKATEQASYAVPAAGPMSMATFVSSYLNPALRALAACHNGSSAPANGPGSAPLAYQEWCDTTSNPAVVKRYDGTSWVAIGSLNTSTHAWVPYLTGGTSGGVPYFSSNGVMASSAALAQYGFVVGGGAGAAPSTITACSDDQIAFGRTGNSPLCRTVTGDLTFATGAATIGANKVVNSMLATMAANTTKCNATAGSAAPTDCSASTMRTNLGVVIGSNVEAWDADLDCIAAISSTGLISRTGAGTCAVRTVTAPAAGITVSNGDGVSGNPTLALANDLAALEGLSGTGIARRTGTDAWSVGTAVANSELATMANATFKCRNTAGTGAPEDCTATQSTALLNAMVGDSGSGGTKGLVPAPGAGDAASGKYLKADGTYDVPPGGSGLPAASQANMESATSNAVASTPGRQHYHPAHPKAVGLITQTAGTYSLQSGSYGITSISKVGTGVVDITISTAFANTNYSGFAMLEEATTDRKISGVPGSKTTTNYRVDIRNAAGTNQDASFSIMLMGDLP